MRQRRDLVKIILTPDANDLISSDGLAQVTNMIGKFSDYWIDNPSVLENRIQDAARDRTEIINIIEEKAIKEGVPVTTIKTLLTPLLIKLLIPFPF